MGVYQDVSRTGAIEIIGTDLNTERAREGAPGRVHGARRAQRRRAAARSSTSCATAKTFALSDAIKSRVTFEFGNLTQTPMPSTGPQDIVFCKNVAIYFSADVTRKLIEGLRDTLAPGGYLLLGHAESLWQMSEGFTLVEHERAFCYGRLARFTAPAPAWQRRKRAETSGPGGARLALSGRHRDAIRLVPRRLSRRRLGRGRVRRSSALVASCPTFVPAHSAARRPLRPSRPLRRRDGSRPRRC